MREIVIRSLTFVFFSSKFSLIFCYFHKYYNPLNSKCHRRKVFFISDDVWKLRKSRFKGREYSEVRWCCQKLSTDWQLKHHVIFDRPDWMNKASFSNKLAAENKYYFYIISSRFRQSLWLFTKARNQFIKSCFSRLPALPSNQIDVIYDRDFPKEIGNEISSTRNILFILFSTSFI